MSKELKEKYPITWPMKLEAEEMAYMQEGGECLNTY